MAGEVEGARPLSRRIDKGAGQSSAVKSECDGQASKRIRALTNIMADARTGIASWNSTERQIYPHKAGLPPPLKSPRHRILTLPTKSTEFLPDVSR